MVKILGESRKIGISNNLFWDYLFLFKILFFPRTRIRFSFYFIAE